MFSRWLTRATLRSRSFPAALVVALGVVGSGALTAGCQQGGVGATCEIREDCSAGLLCCTDCGRRGFCQATCEGTFCPDAFEVDEDAALDAAAEPAPDASETPDADDVDGGS